MMLALNQFALNPDIPLEPNPLQLPLVRGRANLAPPLTRGGWEGFELNGFSVINWIPACAGMTLFSARPAGEQKDSI